MGEKTTNPNGRSNEIEVRRSTGDADERSISESLFEFFGDKKYFQFRGVTAQVTPDGIRVKVDETKTVNIGSDNFVDSPVTPLKEAQTTQVGKGNDKRSTSASKNVKSTSGEEGYRNGTSLEKQDGNKGNNPMSKQNPQNPTNHRRGKRPTSTLNRRTSNKSGKAKNVEGER